MKTLQVPQTTYATYDLTDADELVLSLMLGLYPFYLVVSRDTLGQREVPSHQKVLAIKWWRTRFGSGLKEAKEAVEHYLKQENDARCAATFDLSRGS